MHYPTVAGKNSQVRSPSAIGKQVQSRNRAVCTRRRQILIQRTAAQRRIHATTKTWQERTTCFRSGIGVYGHVLCIRADGRGGVAPRASSLSGTRRKFSGYRGDLWTAQERRAAREVPSRSSARKDFRRYKIRLSLQSQRYQWSGQLARKCAPRLRRQLETAGH